MPSLEHLTPLAGPLLAVGYLLAALTVVRIVLQRREPTATLAWAIGVLAVPYLGALAYFVFGRRRLTRHMRKRRARANAIEPHLLRLSEGIGDLTAPDAPPHLTRPQNFEMIRLSDRIGARPPTCGNRVELFVNAQSAYASIEHAIEQAAHHINLEYYIFQADRTGRRFRDMLTAKVRQGVQVRVLTDGVGSFGVDDFMLPLVQAGGHHAEFLPVSPIGAHWPRANLRNHRKLAIIDGRIAFTGGVNIGDEYTGRRRRFGPWRDTHLRIEGPAVYHVQEVFAEDWHFATSEDPADDRWFPDPVVAGDETLQIVASGPDTDTEPIQRIFFTAVTSARRRVLLTTPYFVPDQAMLVALQTAAMRGVDVRLLLPHRSDMRLVLHAGRSYYDDLIAAGVRIFEYQQGFLHAKTMVVDDNWATVGSANMDVRSFRLNFELNAAIYGAAFAAALAKVFQRDLKTSREITAKDLQDRPFYRRMLENFARTMSPLL